MSNDDHDKPRFDRIADKAVAEAGKLRRELGRGLARSSAKDPSLLSRKALTRLGPEGAAAYVDELRRLFGRSKSDAPDAAPAAAKSMSDPQPGEVPRPPETIEGWSNLRNDKRSPVSAGVLRGLGVGFVLLLLCTSILLLGGLL